MDYRKERVYLNKHRVKQLTVVGKACEAFWYLAFHKRRGMSALLWSDVKTVELQHVVVKGRTKRSLTLALTAEDSQLSLRAARAVVNLAEQHDFRVLDAVVPQKNADGECVGEHDLLCERCSGQVGYSSWEVKLRHLKTRGLKLNRVRQQVQEQSWRGTSKLGQFWPTTKEVGVHRKGDCAERVCVLVSWTTGDDTALGDWSAVHAEAIPASVATNGPESWAPVWGWARPLRTSATGALNTESVQRARQRLAAAAKLKARVQATAAAKRKHEFDAVHGTVRKCTLNRKSMGSVSDFVNATQTPLAKRVRTTIGKKMPIWARKWSWPAQDYGTHPKCSARSGGGSEGHCATEGCLVDVYNFLKPPPPQ
jgi:hypothetical protein